VRICILNDVEALKGLTTDSDTIGMLYEVKPQGPWYDLHGLNDNMVGIMVISNEELKLYTTDVSYLQHKPLFKLVYNESK